MGWRRIRQTNKTFMPSKNEKFSFQDEKEKCQFCGFTIARSEGQLTQRVCREQLVMDTRICRTIQNCKRFKLEIPDPFQQYKDHHCLIHLLTIGARIGCSIQGQVKQKTSTRSHHNIISLPIRRSLQNQMSNSGAPISK